MIFTINNGYILLIFFAMLFAAIVILMILRPGKRGQKLLSIGILVVICSVVYFMFGRPAEVIIDKAGIHSEAYGKINFEWSEVQQAEVIDDYKETEWKPSVRLNGLGLPGFRSGRYRLSNGKQAKVLTQKSEDAVIFQTDEDLYIFAINEHDRFLTIVSQYIEFK